MGKKEGGEDVTDRYVYRGRKVFDKALGGLKGTLKKGFQQSLNGVDFRVLDTRIKGVELEIEVEIIENKSKGVAVLKLYGPNKKKENVVTVSRCKGNDQKYVIILAEKILKPLMKEFLSKKHKNKESCENDAKKGLTIKGEKVDLYKCPHCEKTLYSFWSYGSYHKNAP